MVVFPLEQVQVSGWVVVFNAALLSATKQLERLDGMAKTHPPWIMFQLTWPWLL
jgi:hypothetical protein